MEEAASVAASALAEGTLGALFDLQAGALDPSQPCPDCHRPCPVVEDLGKHRARLGEPPEGEEADAKDPRRLVADAARYLGNNKERMDYPRATARRACQ